MHIKTCLHCTNKFVTEHSYSQSCLPCWKREKFYDLSKADFALELCQDKLTELLAETSGDEIRQQKQEIDALKAELKSEKAINRHLRGKLATALNSKGSSGDGITNGFVMKLLTLCHPDKHGNSHAATEVTKVLLSMRSRR